jgi:RHS repeat-associated protein
VVVTGSGSNAALYWVHGNHLGVPLVVTDSTGASASPPAYTMAGYPGQTQSLSDLYYNRYRDYDSSLGRYIQADPLGLGGGSNPYVYANNNPLRWTDPSGKCIEDACIIESIAIGAAIGAGIDLGIQALNNWYHDRDVLNPHCYNWTEAGISGLLGAFGGGFTAAGEAAAAGAGAASDGFVATAAETTEEAAGDALGNGDTYLYQKLGPGGDHLKYGITKDPLGRYTADELGGGRLKILAQGSRKDMLQLERNLHETLPIGPEEGQSFYIQKQIEKGLVPPPYAP